VMSTFATLLVVPSIFAVVIGWRKAASPSIYPDDPESRHYDPNVYAGQGHAGHAAASAPADLQNGTNHDDPGAGHKPGSAPDALQ
jgi:hypothetical protein